MNDKNIIKLPRGGYLVTTPIGPIQFGSPPETIKDTMKMECGVPQFFVLPNNFFNWLKGISVAEVEFPIYYNFFLRKKKTYIVCNKEQHVRFLNILRESLFGPEKIDLTNEFNSFNNESSIPNIQSEIDYFRHNLEFSDLVEFLIFKDNKVKYEGITIKLDDNGTFNVFTKDEEIATIPGNIEYVMTYDIGKRLPEPFKPPLFGVTCLGSSHGFDPAENTSGFIIWINHFGIMVDPPINTTEWLRDSNVNPKLVDSIILTHCHADHDAGTFQKILEEGRINVYTTETIINSFLRKYAALTDTSRDYLIKLFKFRPLKIGTPEFIHTARFELFYTLHSIPTIGFKMEFQDKSFTYSSDHNNDPDLHKKLLGDKIINKDRFDELSNFPWNSDIIYHEAGIPPLHTPLATLNAKEDKIRKRTHVYHISQKDFEKGETYLKRLGFGIENTLYFDVKTPEYEKSYQILGTLNFLDLFDDMPISKAREFISIVKEEKFKKGELLIKRGTFGDKFYVIASGNVAVITDDLEKRKIYGPCDYFGEAALVTGNKRAADVVAETDVVLYTIEKDKFLHFIEGTELEKTLQNLAERRDSETWNILSTSPSLQILTSTQKTFIEAVLNQYEITKPGVILKEGQKLDDIYIIRDGEVTVTQKSKKVAKLKRGDFIGTMESVYKKRSACYTFTNESPVLLYKIHSSDILKFIDKNPGLIMKLTYDFGKK